MLKQKFLLLALGALVLVTFAVRYKEYVVAKNFTIYAHTACASGASSCFTSRCEDGDDSPECSQGYTKIEILAQEAPKCLLEHSCGSFSCNGYSSCTQTFCSKENLEEGEACRSNLP